MKTDYENYKLQLKNALKYQDFGCLSENIGYMPGLLTLKKINEKIEEKRKIRHEVLKRFNDDITNKLLSKHITGVKMMINPRKIWNNNFLNFKLEKNDLIVYPKVSNNGIFENSYNKDINECLSFLFPYIRALYTFQEENDLLDNSFYDLILVRLMGNARPIFSINGDGVNIYKSGDLEDYEYNDLVKIFNSDKYDILNSISVYDNESLNPYRTDLTKRKALSIYKRGVK